MKLVLMSFDFSSFFLEIFIWRGTIIQNKYKTPSFYFALLSDTILSGLYSFRQNFIYVCMYVCMYFYFLYTRLVLGTNEVTNITQKQILILENVP